MEGEGGTRCPQRVGSRLLSPFGEAIHLAFLIENFQVTNREPIPTAALDQGDWKPASRD
jgi:hypothetical protein